MKEIEVQKTPISKLILINAMVFFVLFAICEGVFRILHNDYQFYQRTYHSLYQQKAAEFQDCEWLQPDHTLGWVCKNDQPLQFYNPDYNHIEYDINHQGFRNARDFSTISDSETVKRILLIGDSFLFGIFLNEEETISARLQNHLGDHFEVLNMSVPGWGIDQMHDAYHEYINMVMPDQVVILYIDEDISRAIEAFQWGATTKNAYRIKKGQLVLRSDDHGKVSDMAAFFIFKSKLINYLYKNVCFKKAQPIAKILFDNININERKNDRELLVMRCPRIEQIAAKNPQYDLVSFFKNSHIKYNDITYDFRTQAEGHFQELYIASDAHLSSKGAELAVAAIVREIEGMHPAFK